MSDPITKPFQPTHAMDLPKLEACGNFVREARTSENLAGFAVAEIPLYAQSNASGIATEIARRCNEYDELKARVAELEAELAVKSRDTDRIDAIYRESWDLECFDYSTGMDDKEIGWRVVEYHQAAPNKRTVAEVFVDDPRQAIDSARKNGGAS